MKIHIIKQGDTLHALSQKHGVPLQKIIEANPQISNPNELTLGDKVKIPNATVPVSDNSEVFYKHTVKQGDSLWKLSKAWGIPLKEMIDANPQLKNPNALMTGEVVNIPKKANEAPVLPQSAAHSADHKTQVGGKTFTGPMEQPMEEVLPLATTPPAVTEPIAAPAPAPIPAPAPAPAPMPTIISNKAPEVAPVHNMMHETMTHETQSLFVQISVPTQEAVAYQMPKENSKAEVSPLYDHKIAPCDKAMGYPGLSENPYLYECPPVHPYYESMPAMGMNSAPMYLQPAFYMPENISPFENPGYISPAGDFPGACYPDVIPEYMNTAFPGEYPVAGYPAHTIPQYHEQPMNLPWPSCGCGGGMQPQSVLPYYYEQPVYNNLSPNTQWQPEAVSPYGHVMAPMPNGPALLSPAESYTEPMVSGIPPYPVYPGMENNFAHHNRVPEIQEPELFSQNVVPGEDANSSETVSNGKVKTEKAAQAKVKTSGHTVSKSAKGASKQRSAQGRTGSARKSKNPWISN